MGRYYEGTMQDRALALMAKKLTAAEALEGTFSSEGLVALAGADANVELALARSLVERLDEGDARRAWSKVVRQLHDTGPQLAKVTSQVGQTDLWKFGTMELSLPQMRRASARRLRRQRQPVVASLF